jgi:hypothetical protein
MSGRRVRESPFGVRRFVRRFCFSNGQERQRKESGGQSAALHRKNNRQERKAAGKAPHSKVADNRGGAQIQSIMSFSGRSRSEIPSEWCCLLPTGPLISPYQF